MYEEEKAKRAKAREDFRQKGIENDYSCWGNFTWSSETCKYDCIEMESCQDETDANPANWHPENLPYEFLPPDALIAQLRDRDHRLAQKDEQLKKKSTAVTNLKLRLNKAFYEGANLYVTHHWGRELVVYQRVCHIAEKEARTQNTGQRACYPYLYETSRERLAKQFHITLKEAAKTIRFFNDSGAWRKVKRKRLTTVYQLGERKKVWITAQKRTQYYNHWYFNLSSSKRATKTRKFYEKEKARLSEVWKPRAERAKRWKLKVKNRK